MNHEARTVLYFTEPELNTAFGLTAPRCASVQPNSLLGTEIPSYSDSLRPFSSLYGFVSFLAYTRARLLVSFAWYCFICRLYQGVTGLYF